MFQRVFLEFWVVCFFSKLHIHFRTPEIVWSSFSDSFSLDICVYNSQVPLNRTEGLKQREQISDDIIIYDVTEDIGDEENAMGDEENAPITPESNEDATSDSSK